MVILACLREKENNSVYSSVRNINLSSMNDDADNSKGIFLEKMKDKNTFTFTIAFLFFYLHKQVHIVLYRCFL